MAATRRLAAVLAADAVGYSRLIGADEQGTLDGLRAIRAEIVDPSVAAHNGRIVKTTGDGFLAEFGSTVDALRCASDIQAQMPERNAAIAPDARLEFRIGIHQGDIVVEDDGDIFGDGVNIAGRLEALAEPGGICVSARVQEDAAGKLDLAFRDLGERQLKNIARAVRAYAIEVGVVRSSGLPATSAPRLSIVVLPLTNLNNDPEQQYFADAITEDLTTDLSRIPGMLVISRNTAFTYRDKPTHTKQIGRELGVRYVLEGSVRRSDNQVRVNAQLIEAETDAHVWAERFTGDLGDLFALQDEITSRIAIALDQAMVRAEAARPTSKPDALDYVFRGRAALAKSRTRDSSAEAIGWFERALALDPRSVEAQLWLVRALTGRVLDGMSSTEAADIARAEDLLRQSFAVSPDTAFAHYAKGNLLRAQRRFADAIPEYETAIALDRNSAASFANLGRWKLFTGALAEAIPMVEQAIRLSPRDAGLGVWYLLIGTTHLLQSRTDEAISWLEKARTANPAHPGVHDRVAAAYGLIGETERAAAELAEARRLSGDPDRFSSVSRLKASALLYSSMAPKVRALYEATVVAGLRKAGMPED
jgi:TolB-like protein/tetratricopeptide (TPR) repeat protein